MDSEHAVRPLATSVDGRRFQFQASLYELPFRAGGYVMLAEDDRSSRLGQILTVGLERTEVDADTTASGGTKSVRAAGGSAAFQQGEALVAGKIASHAAHMRFGAQIAAEGGGDVPASWAAPPR